MCWPSGGLSPGGVCRKHARMSRKKRERRAKKDRAEKESLPYGLSHPVCECMTGELTNEREHVDIAGYRMNETACNPHSKKENRTC